MTNDDDDDDLYDGPDIIEEAEIDKVAARCNSFTKLMALTMNIKDDDLKKESLRMLEAVRKSFKTISSADISILPGGKQ